MIDGFRGAKFSGALRPEDFFVQTALTRRAPNWKKHKPSGTVMLCPSSSMESKPMSVSMYRASIPVYIRGLDVLGFLLQKGATYAREQGLTEAGLIDARLIEDMLPLSGQVKRASDTAK